MFAKLNRALRLSRDTVQYGSNRILFRSFFLFYFFILTVYYHHHHPKFNIYACSRRISIIFGPVCTVGSFCSFRQHHQNGLGVATARSPRVQLQEEAATTTVTELDYISSSLKIQYLGFYQTEFNNYFWTSAYSRRLLFFSTASSLE